ncbi:pyridoxamine 5'-phosphate oxidase [Baekduia soli]|uniref:Pyridoxamine 5'-phosphate oxidase n=1 Tax=Baekduia soli TaxID=496014 RepID=A0A5B8U0Q1_9ACTN|nr:pyridoxamine 5'-phosphate oxidase family protein [Baekduia soli]QEC46566.1 pyridoxamine 5'-phosphate oxidase [Baekduia soli]
MSRRDQITMDDDEVLAFLREERVVTCATNGPRGFPHLMPLWYVVRPSPAPDPPRIWAWTFAKSQKVRNLERDPRATLQVEAGDEYHLLRGVMLETEVVVHRDVEAVGALGLEILQRYSGAPAGELDEGARAMVRKQAAKRVGLEFVERGRATWDHRKLGNVY